MKISYEQIYHDQSTSLKIEIYTDKSQCDIVSWHLHPEYELVFIQGGKGSIQLDSHFEEYTDGLLVFLGPNIPHMPFGNKQSSTNAEVVIQFSESFVQEKLALFPEFQSLLKLIETSKKGIVFSSEIQKKLTPKFLDLKTQNSTKKLLNFIDILHQLSFSENQRTVLKGNIVLESNKHTLQRISKIYQYINDHYGEKIRSETLAKQVGLTPNSFCRMFKMATQRNFIDFLNEFRIKKAQEYFEHHNSSVSQAMYHCGFNDASYFAKQFKKYVGISPSEYLEKCKT